MLWPAASFDVESGFGREHARVFLVKGAGVWCGQHSVQRHRIEETAMDGMLC